MSHETKGKVPVRKTCDRHQIVKLQDHNYPISKDIEELTKSLGINQDDKPKRQLPPIV